jgi:hypothetical protein
VRVKPFNNSFVHPRNPLLRMAHANGVHRCGVVDTELRFCHSQNDWRHLSLGLHATSPLQKMLNESTPNTPIP